MTLSHLKSFLDREIKAGEEIRYLLIDESVTGISTVSLVKK
jgi:hypothetical protein